MLKKKNRFILIMLFLIITAQLSLLILQGQTNKDTSKLQPTPDRTKENSSNIRDKFPVVEYANDPISDDEKAKSKKYDKGLQILFSDLSKNEESLLTLNWAKDLEALPVEKSDVVIIGKVTTAKAHLSAGKKTVFSEFKIKIETIFKNNNKRKFEDGDFINAEREGGIVRYPSGYEIWHRVAGQQMPKVEGRYLFFLTNEFPLYGYQNQGFYILTAYELKEGKVIPLDNPDDSHAIVVTYKEREEIVLLNDLQNALKPR